jgi:hypothetical protein
MVRKGAGYFHAACASEALGAGLLEKVKARSPELTSADVEELAGSLAG